MSVKSVYNFVPAPKESEVFKPAWADRVSHDIPFSDGESGEIALKITAETSIFIRNGHAKDQEENEFSHYIIDGEKKYFIPATSLKGMFRNVLEIMSNSRMNLVKGFNDGKFDVYGMRDMYNDQYKADNSKVKSGWLIKNGKDWIIKPCINHRISLKDIEQKFGLNPESLKNSGTEKLQLCKGKVNGKKYSFSKVRDLGKWVGKQYTFDARSKFEGYIVMYGDIGKKRYDYIFSEPQNNSFTADSTLIKVLDDIEKNNENEESSLWEHLRKENWKPGIPVFFCLNKDGKSVKHFGLTKLYRRNNSYYLNEIEPLKGYLNSDKKDKLDLSELVFGSIRTEHLKGRVFISNAWSKNAKAGQKKERILNSPKPSFYPAYLQQEGKNGKLKGKYKTYHNDNGRLRGFKKYPPHLDIKPNMESDNENIGSEFIPLKEGAVFKGKIRYFNLRPKELGGLLSAITFHGNNDRLFHSLGGAKPYGFGKIKIEIINKIDVNKYLGNFEFAMNQFFSDKKLNLFHKRSAIKELLSAASDPESTKVDDLLKYPLLEKDIHCRDGAKKINEFNTYKEDKDGCKNPKEKEFLENYSERNGTYKSSSKLSRSQLQELDPQEPLNLSEENTFKKLKKCLNAKLKNEGWDEFSDKNREKIYNKVEEIYNSGHKASVRELRKNYAKTTMLPKWLGEDRSKTLYDKLIKE